MDKLPTAALFCIPVTVFALGSSNVLVAFGNRENGSSIFPDQNSVGRHLGVGKYSMWTAKVGANGLILGYCLGQLISSAYLFLINKKDFLSVKFSVRVFKFSVLRNKNYAFIFLPAHLLNTASASGPAFFLSYFFSLNANGFFFKSARVGESLTSVIRSSLGKCLLAKSKS